jgi:hypothetical protein
MVTPLVFDLKLKLKSSGYKIKAVYGSPDSNKATGEVMYVNTLFPTPSNDDGSTNLSNVFDVTDSISQYINNYRIVITKSTLPIGTADNIGTKIAEGIKDRGENIEFDMVSNPDFLKEGAAIDDFMKPDRIIVGANNPRTIELMRELYAQKCGELPPKGDLLFSDDNVPELDDEIRIETALRYIGLYERMTGETFEPGDVSAPVRQRIENNLRKYFTDV